MGSRWNFQAEWGRLAKWPIALPGRMGETSAMEMPEDPEVQIAELRRELARLWWILRVATAAVAVVLAILAFLVFPGAKAEAAFPEP